MKAIFERVSIRQFTEAPVEEEKVERLLRAAMAAPSAGNQQPWEFYIVDDHQTLEALAECSPYSGCAKNAPMAIVPCYRTQGLRFEECVDLDMSAVTQNILLEAVELGLGAVWLCVAPVEDRMANVKRALSLPDGIEAFSIIPCGYPAEERAAADRFDESRIHRVEA